MTVEPRPLPLPLRALSRMAMRRPMRGQARMASMLAPRLLSGDRAYEGADGIVMRVDPDDGFQPLMLLGIFERSSLDALARHARPGSVVVDAGAHIGLFSLHAARAVGDAGNVLSFEVDPAALDRLREHLDLNRATRVEVNEVALSDEEGEVSFHVSPQLGWSTLRGDLAPGSREIEVRAAPLDARLAELGVDPERVSVVKVDVEGAEMEVLRGARGTLERSGAAVIVEFDPERLRATGSSPDELGEFMAELGYGLEGGGGLGDEPELLHDVVFVRS